MTVRKETKKLTYDLNILKETANDLENNKDKALAMTLIEKADFLNSKLKELQEDINANGLNIEMRQGNYTILRANPSCNTYTSFIKNYNSVIKQLLEILPKETTSDLDDEFFN